MTTNQFSNPRDLLKTAVAILLIAGVLTAMMANYQRISLAHFILISLMGFCFALAFRIAVLLVLPLFLRESDSTLRWLSLNAAAILGATLVGGEAASRLLFEMGFQGEGDLGSLRMTVFAIGFGVLISIRLIEFGTERLQARIRSGEIREERVRQQALRAELAVLQARTNPHFLFNSLNTIAGLIEEDPKRAVEVVTRMSALFRHTLHGSRIERVPLEDEIQAISTFLEIQSLRFSDRLSWKVVVEPGLETAHVPPLILQPLVENAVLHGASTQRKTRVNIEAKVKDGSLYLVVEDDGPGPGGSEHRGSGTSLSDLAERMALLFGSKASLETGPRPEGGFRALLRLPVISGLGDSESRQGLV